MSGDVHCSFLMSRSRLAPVKPITIPRLELSAALLGVRTHVTLLRELSVPVQAVHFWTDRVIVLHYISNESLQFHLDDWTDMDLFKSQLNRSVLEHIQSTEPTKEFPENASFAACSEF